MAKSVVQLVGGRLQSNPATDASAGAANAGDIVALDATGRLDQSLMPVGIGADVATVVASEALAAGDYVNIFDNAGTPNVRKADASVSGKEAVGFVLSAVAAGANATVYFEGQNTQLTGLTPGARMYLSAATPGGVTATPPATAGNVVQLVGMAVDATTISTEIEDGIILG